MNTLDVGQTIQLLEALEQLYKKKIWLDIKGRQLRIAEWCDPRYELVELNHEISLVYPAKIIFRNDASSNILHVRGKRIEVDPAPKYAVGKGQSVNIIAKDLEILGYLTETDQKYLEQWNATGKTAVMASFVESADDLNQIRQLIPNAEIVAKIESRKGVQFIFDSHCRLMAARDDLYLELDHNVHEMTLALQAIINIDKNAICASRIFSSLETQNYISFADYADLRLAYMMGYRKFMLCDNICNQHFAEAMKGWEVFINE